MRRIAALVAICIVSGAVLLVVLVRPVAPTPATTTQNASNALGTWKHPNVSTFSKSAMGADVASDAFGELLRICPNIADLLFYASDVTYGWHTEPSVYNYLARTYGWSVQLELQVIIREDADLPPGLGSLPGGARGDHAIFEVGVGSKPGVAVSKATSRYACNLPTNSSDTMMIADPWMASLASRLPTDLVPVSAPRQRK